MCSMTLSSPWRGKYQFRFDKSRRGDTIFIENQKNSKILLYNW